MRKYQSLCIFGLLLAFSGAALGDDPALRFLREAKYRAEYWKARGYTFDPLVMTADSMDRQVQAFQRADYWKERGFKFDATKLSAFAMDRRAEAGLRAEYWKRWGIEFDARLMDAATMDEAAVKLQAIRKKMQEIKEKTGESPAIIIDKKVSDGLIAAPELKTGKVVERRTGPAPVTPIQMTNNLNGGGLGGGLGNRGGGIGQGRGGGGFSLSIGGSGGRGRGAAAQFTFPPGVDPDDVLEQLSGQ